MPSAEVLKRLGDAGIEVKAAASAVDEDAADRALTGRPQAHEEEAQKAQSTNGGQPEAAADGDCQGRAQAPDALLAAGRARPRRGRRRAPRRDRLAGLPPPGRPGRRTARPPAPPAAPRRPPAPWRLRRAGPAGQGEPQARHDPGQLRLDGQGRRRVPRRPDPRGHQEADAAGGDGHAHPDARRRRDPGPRRRVRQGDRDRPRRGRGRRGARVRGRRRGPHRAPAGGHDHGPRRPRQDVAARRRPRGRRRRRRGRRHHPAHRRLPGPPSATRRSPSSTRPATRPSPPCAPAAPR